MKQENFKNILWKNFAASIDMFIVVVKICPEFIWNRRGRFYFMVYHTAVFLDYYLTFPVGKYKPILPYILLPENQLPPESLDDVIPERNYSQEELLLLIQNARLKCASIIGPKSELDLSLNWIAKEEITLHGLCPKIVENYNLLEILFYNLRHLQHHLGQLNHILRQDADMAADWISMSE